MWFPRLGLQGFELGLLYYLLILGEAIHHVVRTLKQLCGRMLVVKKWGLSTTANTNLPACEWATSDVYFLALAKSSDDNSLPWHLTKASWEAPSQHCLAKLLLNYDPQKQWEILKYYYSCFKPSYFGEICYASTDNTQSSQQSCYF